MNRWIAFTVAAVALVAAPLTALAQTGRDLVVSALSNGAGPVSPGLSVAASDTVRNLGTSDADASATRFYLSLDAVKSSNDIRLSGSRTVGVLPGGAESSGPTTLTIPVTTPAATYVLVACADDTKLVVEYVETNNCLASTTTVTVLLADLVQTAVSSPPPAIAPGTAFTVTDTVQNASAVAVASSVTKYYLSADTAFDAADLVLSGSRTVPILAAGASSNGTRSVTVPATAPLGSYYLLACADAGRKVPETSDANNCLAAAALVTLGWPDLVTTSIGDPPPVAAPGEAFVIADTVANQGIVTAGKSTTRFYLSLDGVKDPADVLLAGTRSLPTLSPGATSSGSRSVVVPATTPLDTYVVLACADDLGKVSESDNANNCRASSAVIIRIPNTKPDADAGTDQDVSVGAAIQLDGLNSTDADGDPLTYAWSMLSRPPSSGATLVDATSALPSFTVDVTGQYVLQLIVNDGKDPSRPDVVIVAVGATRFAAMGDTGQANAGQYAGAAALDAKCRRSGCGFVILLGDNIYDSGVTSTSDDQFNTKFEAPYAAINLPFYVVLGNHDYGGGGWGNEFEKGQFEVDYSNISTKWRMPAAYYSFSMGPIDFFGLDTNMQMYGLDQQQRADVAVWLSASTAPWKIALGHHPYRSNGGHGNAGAYGGYTGLPVVSGDGVKAFMDDVVCGRADLMLSGHDHNLQWLQPDGTCAGTELLVSGAGADPKPLRDPGSAYYNQTYFQAAQLGFVYLVATPEQLTAEFIGEDGSVLFVRTLTK